LSTERGAISQMQLQQVLRQIEFARAERPANSLVLVGIGGQGASGKTTLANAIASSVAGTQIVSTDAFYNGQSFELDRLLTDVVQVIVSGRNATYKAWDWSLNRPNELRTVRPQGVVLIDGVCALDHRFRDFEALRIWVNTPPEVRLVRGIARDGEASRDRWINVWFPSERSYVERDQPMQCAHMIVNGNQPF
jgi:uridine kinase